MQDRKTQDEEAKHEVLQNLVGSKKHYLTKHKRRYIKYMPCSLDNILLTYSSKVKPINLIKKAYNDSQGQLNNFISEIKSKFDINDNELNPILEDGFNAIQKHCGQEFNIETMNALNGERACCWRMLFGNNTDPTDYRNFKILYDFIQGQEIINYATIAAEDDSLKIALRECLNERFAAIGHNL